MVSFSPRIKTAAAVCSPAPTCHRSLAGVRTPLMAASVGPGNCATRALILSAIQPPDPHLPPGATPRLVTRTEALTPAFSRSPRHLLYALILRVQHRYFSFRICKPICIWEFQCQLIAVKFDFCDALFICHLFDFLANLI